MAFCKRVKPKINSLLKAFDEFVQKHVEVALTVTEGIKKIAAGVTGDIITSLIPGTLDDAIRARLLQILPYAIDTLKILDACKEKLSLQEKANCFITELKKVDPALQEAILHKLASIITRELDNSKLAQNVYDLFVQVQYSLDKK